MMESMAPITQEPIGGLGPDDVELSSGRQLTGLGPLRDLNSIIIKQKISTCEVLTGCETQNKFLLNGPAGDTILWAKEHSTLLNRLLCGNIRSFDMTIKDQTNQTVMGISRPLTCMGCCCSFCYPHCTQALRVNIDGEAIGTVRERATWWNPVIHVFDSVGNQVFKIRGPSCLLYCCDDISFSVLDPDGTEVGLITKKWMGCWKETLTDADNFVLNFGDNMDLRQKVLLIASTFLIDIMYFEVNG